ncbi:FAD-dependent oxidoreductase [Chromobacterium haemolyticum]|nr:FAD-dependent oxidoreductase [Chromobacterium haemolyticum]
MGAGCAAGGAQRQGRRRTRRARVDAHRLHRRPRDGEHWLCELQAEDGSRSQVRARALVNAAGPWVESLIKDTLALPSSKSIRLVKGSHIVVKKLFDHPYAYIFQNPDKRIIFAIPYEQDFTLIGTTDVEYRGDPAKVAIDDQEVAYLCQMSNRYFQTQISPADVLSTYSGVRPLLDDEASNAASVTRDYSLEMDLNGARRCCRCSAARSPPSANWRKKRWTNWRRCWATARPPGPPTRRCRAATCRARTSSVFC